MYSHEPADYDCPFCGLIAGRFDGINSAQDVVRQTETALAFVSPRWWPNNHGHVLVIPSKHQENLYDLEPAYGHGVHDLSREVAIAIRATYGCSGTSVRQHNEPDGNQDVWHYHVHVFPRYANDHLYGSQPEPGFVSQERRLPYAEKLRAHVSGSG